MELLNALAHHRAGRIKEATQIYARVLQAEPDNADALHLMGNAAAQLGDVDLSISLISRASGLAPKNTAYLSSLGLAYRLKRQFDLALDCYARALELEPDCASAHFNLGNTLQSMGRLPDAAKSFARALELNPDFFEAHYNLANIRKSSGEYLAAIDHYRIAVTLKPDFADAHHNLGSALQALGRVDEALASYQRALAADLPETHNNIGNLFFARGEPDRALSFYRQALALQPSYPEAHNNLGATLRKLGQPAEAAEAFREALRLMPGYAVAHLNLGDLLMDGDLADEAVREYEQAIAAAPEMAAAHFQLGVARNRQGDPHSAYRCFERAVALDPGHLDALYNLGVINGRLMRSAEAERCYLRVLELEPNYVSAHINLSAILMEDGRTDEAQRHIDLAYSTCNLFEKRAPAARRTVLLLLDAGKGNLNLTHLFNDKTNSLIDWMIEYAADDQFGKLPDHDLVFNAMGDPDQTGNTSGPVGRFLQICQKPLLNHPDQVALTARHKLPALLDGIDGLQVPAVWRYPDGVDWDESVIKQLPLLIRPVHTHGGIGMTLVADEAALAQFRASQDGPVYVARFFDYRAADSWFRKYRMIFIDRRPFPYHLAISQNWMVHYYTAEMEPFPWKLAEEQAFLRDPEAVLGAAGMRAIETLGARMDLEYAGVDFTIMPDGRLLVFEANPTMLVHPEKASGPLEHKNLHVQRIFDAFENLLDRLQHPSP